jgi:hypothetical protein
MPLSHRERFLKRVGDWVVPFLLGFVAARYDARLWYLPFALILVWALWEVAWKHHARRRVGRKPVPRPIRIIREGWLPKRGRAR